jgi:hypothetical protein
MAGEDRLNSMTFNGEFLWDGVDPEEGSADFPWKGSQTEAEDHMCRLAEVIISTCLIRRGQSSIHTVTYERMEEGELVTPTN